MSKAEDSKTNRDAARDRSEQPKPRDHTVPKKASDGPVDESDNGPATAPGDIGEG